MEPLKGIDFLLRAIALLKDWNIPVGGTRYECARSPINSSLKTASPTSPNFQELYLRDQTRAMLAAAHIFLMPHLTSDLGRAFFDAIAAGTLVIAFRSSPARTRYAIEWMA